MLGIDSIGTKSGTEKKSSNSYKFKRTAANFCSKNVDDAVCVFLFSSDSMLCMPLDVYILTLSHNFRLSCFVFLHTFIVVVTILLFFFFFFFSIRFVHLTTKDHVSRTASQNSIVRFFELDIKRNTLLLLLLLAVVVSLATTAQCVDTWYKISTVFFSVFSYFMLILNGFFYRFQLFVSNVQDKWISMSSILFIVVSSSGLIHRKL